jgi:hypothetical protein
LRDLVDGFNEERDGFAFDGPIELLGEAAVAVLPDDGAFDNRPARLQLNAVSGFESASR